MSTNQQFKADLTEFIKRANVNAETVIRKVALDLLSGIVGRSPVLTGRFRGSWVVQRDLSPVDPATLSKSGASTITRGAAEVGSFKVGENRYIVNFLPYSIVLEDGGSDQSPNGMVKITVEEFQTYINNAARGLKQ